MIDMWLPRDRRDPPKILEMDFAEIERRCLAHVVSKQVLVDAIVEGRRVVVPMSERLYGTIRERMKRRRRRSKGWRRHVRRMKAEARRG